MPQEMVGSEHVFAQPFVHRFEPPACVTGPAGKCRTAEIDALAGKDVRLPIERSVSTADATLPVNVEPEVFAEQMIRQRFAAWLCRRNFSDDLWLVFPDAANVAVDVFQTERELIRIDANKARRRPITGSSALTSSCRGGQTDGPSFFSTSCTSMARPSMPLLVSAYPSANGSAQRVRPLAGPGRC
jgi:hypothetical protein